MPYLKIYIHFVWSTKNRTPFLEQYDLRRLVWDHIQENAIKKNIYIDTINGYQEHCHSLISLRGDQTISNTMQMIKGESSFWINKNGLCKQKFEWQDEYFGVSISPTDVESVRAYIRNQEEHHHRKTFKEELDEFIARHNFQMFKDESILDGHEL